jgi:hypothetical protein
VTADMLIGASVLVPMLLLLAGYLFWTARQESRRKQRAADALWRRM